MKLYKWGEVVDRQQKTVFDYDDDVGWSGEQNRTFNSSNEMRRQPREAPFQQTFGAPTLHQTSQSCIHMRKLGCFWKIIVECYS